MQNIGEDLFAIALDQPFRFPATFTFVLRAFSTLEGLGKVSTSWRQPDQAFELVGTVSWCRCKRCQANVTTTLHCHRLQQALDPNYSFAETAKPYALELLNLQVYSSSITRADNFALIAGVLLICTGQACKTDRMIQVLPPSTVQAPMSEYSYQLHVMVMQDAQQAQGFVLERLQSQAVQMGSDAAAMPGRVAAIDRWRLAHPSCSNIQSPCLELSIDFDLSVQQAWAAGGRGSAPADARPILIQIYMCTCSAMPLQARFANCLCSTLGNNKDGELQLRMP